MRRKVGIVVGACTALALAGGVGAATFVYTRDAGRVVGTWHEAPDDPTSTVAAEQSAPPGTPAAVTPVRPPARPASARAAAGTARIAPVPVSTGTLGGSRAESASTSGAPATQSGRQRVGTLLRVSKLIGYDRAAQPETFHYPQASYVKLHFSQVLLLPGDYLTVTDAAGVESHRYQAPPLGDGSALLAGTPPPSDRWAMSVTGDTAVLRLHRVAADPAGLRGVLDRLGVQVDRVARGYTPGEQSAAGQSATEPTAPPTPAAAPSPDAPSTPAAPSPDAPPSSGRTEAGRAGPENSGLENAPREESVCGGNTTVDAICYRSVDPVAYTRSKAIARLLINGTELCTGWRIGARNRMVTNNHCLASSAEAYQTEVWFNYQCARCGARQMLRATKVWGDRVLTTNRIYDYTLFTVERFDEVKRFGYLSLDTRRPPRGEELYLPQHPAGKPTQIAGTRGERAGTCSVVDPAYEGYAVNSDVSYYCDTEGGSSGSPVLSRRTDRVVALHHFGGCPNSGVRADIIHARIKRYL